VWEDALERGLVERTAPGHDGVRVVATARGQAFLRANRRPSAEAAIGWDAARAERG
jgi:hypothetical protein